MDKINRLIKNLKEFQKDINKVKIPVKTDEDGYIDKECPNEECLFQFKVNAEDWGNNFKDEKVFCPNCKNESAANTYYPSEFIGQFRRELIASFREKVLKGKQVPYDFLPYIATKKWNLKIECESCGSRYSVIGSAFFCPCCGHNSIEKHFEDSVVKINLKIHEIENIKSSIVNTIGADNADIIARSIKESCLSDCVVSFQHYSNLMYLKISGKKPKFNIFQKIVDGSETWKKEIGEGYEDWISSQELNLMNKLFQQRHLFLHSDGIVDQMYLEKSGDSKYKIGQRIVINDNELIKLVETILKIAEKVKGYGT